VDTVDTVDMVDAAQFARNCHGKTLLSLCWTRAFIVRLHDRPPFTSFSTPSSNIGENISDMGAAVNISHFGMTWHQ
jgi:hypothetical protein